MIESLLLPLVPERFICDDIYHEWYVNVINPLPRRRILGVHTPELKTVAKQLAKRDDVLDLLHQFAKLRDSLCHEECMVWGFAINALDVQLKKRLELVGQFVPAIDNWAVCDAFCGNAKWVNRSDKNVISAFLESYFASENEFYVRFAIILSMSYLTTTSDELNVILDKLEELDFNRIKSEYLCKSDADAMDSMLNGKGVAVGPAPYYVKMGIAWFLATMLAKFPAEIRAYIHRSTLPQDVIKLYIRKARESYRTRYISAI